MKKTEKIKLFGLDLILSERVAMDVLDVIAFSKRKEALTLEAEPIALAFSVATALKCNYVNLKFWQFKKYKLKRMLSTKNLLKKLSGSELKEFQAKILLLENVDLKKKVKG